MRKEFPQTASPPPPFSAITSLDRLFQLSAKQVLRLSLSYLALSSSIRVFPTPWLGQKLSASRVFRICYWFGVSVPFRFFFPLQLSEEGPVATFLRSVALFRCPFS